MTEFAAAAEREAATVVLGRDGAGGLEVLLLRRSADSPAFPGMWVFPGGTVTDEDRSHPDPLAAAAVRECREECGLEVDPLALVVFSEWMPPPSARHRFRTMFFFAPMRAGTVQIDDFEVVEHAWIAPAAALLKHAEGEWDFLPPTWVTLTALAEASSLADATDALQPPARFRSHLAGKEPTVLAWEGDSAHPDSAPPATGTHRLTLGARPWTYEHTI